MYDAITIGSSTVDVFARTKTSGLIKIFDSKGETNLLAYPAGSKILVEELNFTTGGGATNTAVCLARLGHKVACISKMGSAANAAKIVNHLKKDRVDPSLIVCSKNGRTGYSIILDSIEHDRTILAYKGSNNELKFNELKLKKLKTRWFYFSTMLDESFKTLEKLTKFAEKNKIKVAFNASQYLAKKGPKFLKNILSRTTIFILNKDEAKLLVKLRNPKDSKGLEKSKTFQSKQKTLDLLRAISKLGPGIVVITDGKNELSVFDGKVIYSVRPNKIKVVETTGAGDAFAASFLSGMIKKNDIEFAIKLALINAESVIQHHGAKNKLLTYKEVLKLIKSPKIKVKKKKLYI